jgi:hypothetical protein
MSWELIIAFSGLIFSIISIGVAIWSARKSNSISKEQTDLQRRMVDIEERKERDRKDDYLKARIEVNILKRETASGRRPYQVRIINKGKGDARNVTWFINGIQPSDYPDILDSDNNINVIKRIKAGTGQVAKIATSKDSEKVWIIKVIWDDDANKKNAEEFELRL